VIPAAIVAKPARRLRLAPSRPSSGGVNKAPAMAAKLTAGKSNDACPAGMPNTPWTYITARYIAEEVEAVIARAVRFAPATGKDLSNLSGSRGSAVRSS
jgi:hypothetical protein